MRGQYIRSIDRQLINEENTILWLSRGYLKGEKSEIKVAHEPLPQKIMQQKY